MKYIGKPDVYTTGIIKLEVGCSKCGHPVEASYKHCPECGKKLEPLPTRVSSENLDDELTKLVRKGVLVEAES